eukprot:6232496-Prymnesium_polylepis.3
MKGCRASPCARRCASGAAQRAARALTFGELLTARPLLGLFESLRSPAISKNEHFLRKRPRLPRPSVQPRRVRAAAPAPPPRRRLQAMADLLALLRDRDATIDALTRQVAQLSEALGAAQQTQAHGAPPFGRGNGRGMSLNASAVHDPHTHGGWHNRTFHALHGNRTHGNRTHASHAERVRNRTHAGPSGLRVAALYSGRFYGNLTTGWVDNHLRYLIRPLHADVFVTTDPDNWCHAPEDGRRALQEKRWDDADAVFQREVRSAFSGWRHVYGRLVSGSGKSGMFVSSTAMRSLYSRAAKQVPIQYSYFWYSLLRRWYMQFLHYADVEELRGAHGPHDIVIRVRLDVTFSEPCTLPFERLADDKTVLALGYYGKQSLPGQEPMLDAMASECDEKGERVHGRWATDLKHRHINESSHAHIPCQQLWRDYLFVGTSHSMAPLAQMAEDTHNRSKRGGALLFDRTTRCYGLCAEEQTVLQYQNKNVSLAPLGWPWKLNRLQHGARRTPAKPNSQVCTSGAGVKISR